MSSNDIFGKEVSEAQAADYEQLRSESPGADAAAREPEPSALEITQCPECGARRFISKLLVFEETAYDEFGEQETRRQAVRAEFEFTCGECETILRMPPTERRDYYEDVQVLAADRRADLRVQNHTLSGRVARQLWTAKSQLVLVLTVLVAVVLLGL